MKHLSPFERINISGLRRDTEYSEAKNLSATLAMFFQSYFDSEITLEKVGGMINSITLIECGTVLHIKSSLSYSFTESQLFYESNSDF